MCNSARAAGGTARSALSPMMAPTHRSPIKIGKISTARGHRPSTRSSGSPASMGPSTGLRNLSARDRAWSALASRGKGRSSGPRRVSSRMSQMMSLLPCLTTMAAVFSRRHAKRRVTSSISSRVVARASSASASSTVHRTFSCRRISVALSRASSCLRSACQRSAMAALEVTVPSTMSDSPAVPASA